MSFFQVGWSPIMTNKSQILALKYRPQIFEDLIGQEEIAQALETSQQVIAYQLKKLKEQAKTNGIDEVFNSALMGGLAGAVAGVGVVALLELLKNQKE